MRGQIYYLSTCDTCKRILGRINTSDMQLREIKSQSISPEELDMMKSLAGTYEALFSKRARNYKALNLAEKVLTEQDIRSLILQDYTFLKRPVIIRDGEIFIGNAPSTVAAAEAALAV